MSPKGATLPIDDAPVTQDVQLVRRAGSADMVLTFERLARDPLVDADKLQKLVDLQERILDRDARSAFTAAFIAMRPEIPEIDEKGRILNKNGNVQSTYSRHEDIQRVILPILFKHGFELSFRTEWPEKTLPSVVGILTHRDGHQRESRFQAHADMSGSKNDVQGLGSTISYGKRYSTIDLLNITTRGKDDDAQSAGKKPETASPPPEGYQDWLDNLTAAADEGWPKFKEVWNPDSVKPFREWLMRTDAKQGERLKIRAQKVSQS